MLAEAIRKPDMTRYIEGRETEGDFRYGLYCAAESLIDGAIAMAQRAEEDGNEEMGKVYDLLSAFKAVMENGDDALCGAKKKDLPRITIDELKDLLGDVGGAEVQIGIGGDGFVSLKRYHVGKKYTLGSDGEQTVLVEVPPAPEGRPGKKNGKAKGKAA